MKYVRIANTFFFLILTLSATVFANASVINLTQIDHQASPTGNVEISLNFSQPLATAPKSFVIKNPETLIFDFNEVGSTLENNRYPINTSSVNNLQIVKAPGRMRVLIRLNGPTTYSTQIKNQQLIITIKPGTPTAKSEKYREVSPSPTALNYVAAIKSVDFQPGKMPGSGRIVLTLNQSNVKAQLDESHNTLELRFLNTSIPDHLLLNYNVTDFNTVVKNFIFLRQGTDAQLSINTNAAYQQTTYQNDKQFVIEVSKKSESAEPGLERGNYRGDKVSLNFQSIPVRAVLQVLAEFTGTNVIISDKVSGNITLRLNNVPWDQALDFILHSQGLAKFSKGNILMIGPAAELAAQEKAGLKAQQDIQALAPLATESFVVNYGKIADFYKNLTDPQNGFLSARGRAIMLQSTNTITVEDTEEKLKTIRQLFKEADIPAKQVLIEARIVYVRKNLEDSLGISWNVKNSSGVFKEFSMDFPATSIGGVTPAGLALGSVFKGLNLDLEISALESETGAELVASPRLMTSNNVKASIEQGQQIPYSTSSASGGTTVTLVPALLKLEVTPQITPNNKLILDLTVTQNTVGAAPNGSPPPIDTRAINTNILVDNGETVVLGGIYEEQSTKVMTRVPFLSAIPVVGGLFSNSQDKSQKNELLIFLTPKIIDNETTNHNN